VKVHLPRGHKLTSVELLVLAVLATILFGLALQLLMLVP
jgi:hypothetical protein